MTETTVKLPKGVKYLPELFEALKGFRTKAERVELLHQYVALGKQEELTLRCAMQLMFREDISMELPHGPMPSDFQYNIAKDYKESGYHLFKFFHNRHYIYFVPMYDKFITNQVKREQMFFNYCMRLYKDEADLLVAIKDKDPKPYRALSRGLIEAAFPEWLDTLTTGK